MARRGPAACVALAVAIAAAAVLSRGGAAAQPAAQPDAVITRYRAALDRLPALGNVVFRYTESRSGPARTLEEEHRVYRRADGEERNETTAVNGTQVVPAIVRYSSKPVWPYDVRNFAVDPNEYNVLALGAAVVAGKRAFGFSAVRATTGDFSVTGVYLDAKRYLPLRESFAVSGGGCAGTGSIDFAAFGSAWLPTLATVSCTVAQGGATFKETIAFRDFAFPPFLPPDVFGGRP